MYPQLPTSSTARKLAIPAILIKTEHRLDMFWDRKNQENEKKDKIFVKWREE
jgi:hypothetical protein